MQPKYNEKTELKRKTLAVAIAGTVTLGGSGAGFAQDDVIEEVMVTGIRGSLTRAMDIKRDANGVVDAISAEDIGKFPDLNVAESLQRVTGVSIDRSGGEGQAVTVRGLGPQFNTVLVNGRQLATDSFGREFNFDVLAADLITGADVYKSTRADLQEGAIGATINISTAKPFDNPGLQLVGSVKGMYETLSEETSPSASFLVSNTFADDTIGVLLAYSRQERDVQINRIETAGWRPGQTISNNAGDNDPNTTEVLFTNAYIPRNWDQIVDQQERTRDNASLVFQFAPSDDVTITLDGFISKFEVDSQVTDLASWFEPDRVGEATIDPATGTLLSFTQEIGLSVSSGDPATDFVSHTRFSRDVSNDGFGLNVAWDINDQLSASFDASTSTAENDRAGRDRFNVVGIINNYSFDGIGGTPTVRHDGFENGQLPDPNLSRLHYNEKGNRFSDEDEITEYKADFTYESDHEIFQQAKFGIYRQEREKSSFQIFGSQCQFCGYGTPAPNDVINFRPFTADNFFGGLIDTFYTYDGDAYVQFLADSGFPIETELQNNRYTINEDINSVYADFTFGFDLRGMPLTVNVGGRYAQTDIDVGAVQSFITDVVPTTDLTLFANRFGPAVNISDGGDYSDFLPTLSAKLEVRDDMILRFAAYRSMTRPTMSELSPATTFNEPRRQNLTAQGGNPTLDPFTSDNWDLSFEWYYNDSSVVSIAYFEKEVDDFITSLSGQETFVLTDRQGPGFRCAPGSAFGDVDNDPNTPEQDLCDPATELDPNQPGVDLVAITDELNGAQEVYTVNRPQNSESADIDGWEIALTHVFDNGFGIAANATFVDSNVSLGADTTETFALEGLGDSQNLIVFYEAENWQVRVAYNNRDDFLRYIDNTNRNSGGVTGEPVNTEEFGQWDISASYDISENLTIFFEGINVTEEELVQTGRFENQIYNIEDNGSRYAIGIRGKFF